MTEDALIGAYNPPAEALSLDVRQFQLGSKTFRSCLCGSWIGLDPLGDWTDGMREHQATRAHRQWRARNRL